MELIICLSFVPIMVNACISILNTSKHDLICMEEVYNDVLKEGRPVP